LKDEDETKAEPIKELKTIRKEREKSVINDIAERKQAEEELKDSEKRLKILFDYAPERVAIKRKN
jgi:PAS domain-containing protein